MPVRAEQDGWGPGPSILDPKCLRVLEAAIATTPLIIQHWHYRAAQAPSRLVFDDFRQLEEYLTQAKRGDAFDVWRWDQLCRTDSVLARGKRPDPDGAVPSIGAY